MAVTVGHPPPRGRPSVVFLPSVRGRWLVLTVVSLGLLLPTIDTSILYIAVPVPDTDLGASTSQSL